MASSKKCVLRDPSHWVNRPKSKTSPRKWSKISEDSHWLNACIQLEDTLKRESEGRIQTDVDISRGNSCGSEKTSWTAPFSQAQNDKKISADAESQSTLTALRQAWDDKHRINAEGFPKAAANANFGQAQSENCASSAPQALPSSIYLEAEDGGGMEKSHAITELRQAQTNNVQEVTTITNKWKWLSLEEALNILEEGASPQPSSADLACLLCKCRIAKNQQHAARLHAYMRQNGLDFDRLLGNHLVYMLVENGCTHSAHQAFDRLAYQSHLSWNSLISGYIKTRELNRAIVLYQRMAKNEALSVNDGNVVALLKACTKQKDLRTGKELHAKAAKLGLLGRNTWIANAVIDMYSKCGLLAQAHSVLESLPTRDVVSWTSLITGYVDHGLAEEALKCLETMQHEGINPDRVILVCSLRACGSLGAMDKVQEIHIHCERLGLLERDATLGTMLLNIYATCGLLSRAQQVFDKLSRKDVITWTALISGYTEHGHGKEALRCFDRMQREGVSPDTVTFICSLKACCILKAVDKVQELHVQIERSGLLKKDGVVGTVLVDTYAKCGAIDKSLEVFNRLKIQDVVSWTALIEGYAEHGHGEEALKCFEQMQLEGISPNAITYSCSLKACSSIGALRQGRKLHCQIERRDVLKKNLVVGNALVDMYIKCGLLAKAHRVFDKLPSRDVVSWTSLIAGYAEHGHGDTALSCFDQMQLEGVSPNAVTYIFCLKACAAIGDADKGEEIHLQIENEGLLQEDAILGNAVVDMYAAFGVFAKAERVFDQLSNRNVVLWTSLIARFAQHGYAEEALNRFERMQHKGVCPNDVTLVTVLKVCGSIGAIDKVQDLHVEIERRGLLKSDLVGNALVFVYSKCGLLALAHEVFDMLQTRDVVSWNSLIAGYAQVGETEIALSVFDQMLEHGLRPGSITFTNILSACNRQGYLGKSWTYFEAMSKDYGIVLAPEHLCGMLDIFCRSGEFDRAKSLLDSTSNNSNVVMRNSFLGACKQFQNMELGKWAFDHTVHLGGKEVAPYALMSCINGGSNTQNEVGCPAEKSGIERTVLLLGR